MRDSKFDKIKNNFKIWTQMREQTHLTIFWLFYLELAKFDTTRLSDIITTRINGYKSLNLTRLLNGLGSGPGRHNFFCVGLRLKFLIHLPTNDTIIIFN